jgi:uncharacterized membrane protein YGL010W
MKTLTDHLSKYASYHRDPRNIATHFLGIPMIAWAIEVLLARPSFNVTVGDTAVPASPLLLVTLVAVLAFYARLDKRYALAMLGFYAVGAALAVFLAAQSTAIWLGAGIGLFVVGWVIQFVGHFFEGKKPAFVDDLVGLLVGPLFIVAEAGFAVGMRDEVKAEIEKRSGPVRVRVKSAA